MCRSLFVPWAVAVCLGCAVLSAGPARAAGLAAPDPFDTAALTAAGPADSRSGALRGTCGPDGVPPPLTLLTLADVVDRALCNNPQTRLAWANARAQAAQVGVAQGAYLPTLAASAGVARIASDNGASLRYGQASASLSASYLLYDFGGRAATLENARQLAAALASTQDATLQAVFLAAVQAYYQWFAADAAVAAARESERASQESLKAAEVRYRIGTGTPADRLQAQTAASQAVLARIQAEGGARTSRGVLANAMGLDAQQSPPLAPPAADAPGDDFTRDLDALIATARQARPDLAAAEAQVKAARAAIDAARASGMPTLSATAGSSYSDTSVAGTGAIRGNSIGLALSVPLFTGFNAAYRARGAEAQFDAKAAQRDQLDKQVSLDVWRNYHALVTNTEAVRASANLVASAEASEQVAAGRYRAGVGGILDLLNAQSALAAARQQHIQALYNWRIAKVALAQAMGQLDFSQISAR